MYLGTVYTGNSSLLQFKQVTAFLLNSAVGTTSFNNYIDIKFSLYGQLSVTLSPRIGLMWLKWTKGV